MAKTRIHELAKELDKSSSEIVDMLASRGIADKTPQSSLEDSRYKKNVLWYFVRRTALLTEISRPAEEHQAVRAGSADLLRARRLLNLWARDLHLLNLPLHRRLLKLPNR